MVVSNCSADKRQQRGSMRVEWFYTETDEGEALRLQARTKLHQELSPSFQTFFSAQLLCIVLALISPKINSTIYSSFLSVSWGFLFLMYAFVPLPRLCDLCAFTKKETNRWNKNLNQDVESTIEESCCWRERKKSAKNSFKFLSFPPLAWFLWERPRIHLTDSDGG